MMSLQGSLSIGRMCQLAEVSRANFYRPLEKRERVEEELFLANSRTRLGLERLARYALLH